jgi:hypothetical protein
MSPGPTEPAAETEPEPEAAPDEASAPAEESRPRSRRRRRGRRPSTPKRAASALLGGLVAVALAVGLWSVGPVRTVLLQSFTEQQSPYTELYFTAAPAFDGATVVVPITIDTHGTDVSSFTLKVQLETDSGAVVSTATVALVPRDGTPVSVVARPVLPTTLTVAVSEVDVILVGHPQRLHYAFGN